MTNFKISLPPPFVDVVAVVDIGPVVDITSIDAVVFDSPPENITAIGITILEIIITETQVIMTITTFPDKTAMVTDIMPKFLSIHVNLIVPTEFVTNEQMEIYRSAR